MPAEAELIHTRTYDVQSYRLSDERMMIRGVVHDVKPPFTYIADDPEPMSVHHMVVDLTMAFPMLEIVDVGVSMNVTPHMGCTKIEPDYQKLVGLSIARGFSRKVKELFGGPSGCTHIGALLQAMAPVAVQSMWSMRAKGADASPSIDDMADPEAKKAALAFNINSCHIWAEDGEQMNTILSGGSIGVPVWAENRMRELGRDPAEWAKRG